GSERDHGVDDQRRHHRDDRRRGEYPLVGAHRRDVFLDHQLHGVGNRLQDPVRAHSHRPEARLRPGDDLALEEHHVGDRREHNSEEDDDDLQERDDELIDHRSTSPSTMSIDPISATTSATRWPRTRRRSPWRFANEGGRTRKRYGFVLLPSLTMK